MKEPQDSGVYRISKNVYHSRKDNLLRIVHIERDDLISLSGPAAEIFLSFDGEKKLADIKASIETEHKNGDVEKDFLKLLKFLRDYDLIEEV